MPGSDLLQKQEPLPSLNLRSADRRFGLHLPSAEIGRILEACVGAMPRETGGILVGRYSTTLDYAIVTRAGLPPEDSESGRISFRRGIKGLQSWIGRLWSEEGIYYLGEWHSHPLGRAEPSLTDLGQMYRLAESPELRCPEPILLVVGGDPEASWDIRAWVVPRRRERVELLPSYGHQE